MEGRLRCLHGKLEEQQPTEDVQDGGEVSRLLEDMHEVIDDYKVRPRPLKPSQILKGQQLVQEIKTKSQTIVSVSPPHSSKRNNIILQTSG